MQQTDLFAYAPTQPARNDRPTRAPNPRATQEWAQRSRDFAAAHPDVFACYVSELDRLAAQAAANGETYIAPRLAWEATRRACKVRLSNAFQAAWSAEWQRTRPELARLIRNGRGRG